MMSYPIEPWQTGMLVVALIVIVVLCLHYFRNKELLKALNTDLTKAGLPVLRKSIQSERQSEEVADVLRAQNYEVNQTAQGTLLARPKRSFFRLNHLGLYWFQMELQPSLHRVALELKMSLLPWGILLGAVVLWLTLSYRMPVPMKCAVFLVLIPDILTLLVTLQKYFRITALFG